MATSNQSPIGWVARVPDLPALLQKRSGYLLGPRQTGKTSLIRRTLPAMRATVYECFDILKDTLILDNLRSEIIAEPLTFAIVVPDNFDEVSFGRVEELDSHQISPRSIRLKTSLAGLELISPRS